MTEKEFKQYKVTRRPYPFDFERKQIIERVMYQHGIRTISELARKIKIERVHLTNVINGTRHSKKTEKRIAAFFKMDVEYLFPKRTGRDLAEMNMRQQLGGRAC